MKSLETHIEEVMDWFDFNKVKKVMDFLDWKWGMGQDAAIPEIADMRAHVRKYMRDLYNQNKDKETVHAATGSGGFIVEYFKGIDNWEHYDNFNVTFEVSGWTTSD